MRTMWASNARKKGLLSTWVANIIWPDSSRHRDFGNCQAMGVVHDAQLVAAVIFHNWEPDSGIIELSSASINKRWLTRPILKEIFEYPFNECGCQAVVMRVADDNQPMHRIAKAYGFEHYVIPRLRGRDANENVFVLTDDTWKNNRFNRKNEVS